MYQTGTHQQISVKDTVKKMGEIVTQQRNNGYQAGWCFHQMKKWTDAHRCELAWFHYGESLASQTAQAASGELSSETLRQEMNEAATDWNETCEEMGWDRKAQLWIE